MKTVRTLSLVMCVSFLLCGQAFAETYEKPTLKNIVRTLVRFGAVDIYDDNVIDVFARTNECEIYKKFYQDSFKWEKVRGKLREDIRNNVAVYPTGYRYDTVLKLDRYDFKNKVYPFTHMSRQQNVNTFTLETAHGDYCTESTLVGFPSSFKLVLGSPVVLEGLPLNEQEGESLFYRMNENNNAPHVVFASFYIRPVYIASLATAAEIEDKGSSRGVAKVHQSTQYQTVIIDSRLDSVDYFEDEARTKLIYTYRP